MTTITATGLTKRFGALTAVDDLGFTVEPGTITGFLGPNGAGKTTTLRMLLGLVRPSAGTVTFDGRPYGALDRPGRTVGAVLEASAAHPARTGRDHLRIVAAAGGIDAGRVDAVLDEVGLRDAAHRTVRGYSLGMRQRLALGAALLGDPDVLLLDEPTNGLDPEGVHWLRELLRARAARGHTILVSSHLLAELDQLVDRVLILDHGRLVAAGPLAELVGGQHGVRVRTPDAERLAAELRARGMVVDPRSPDELFVVDAAPDAVGRAVAAVGVVVYEMTLERPTLESLFLELTASEEVAR
ncbi:MAG TPA: ABC transporter ATP-binding protein [Acidimicrobiia bacterium]|nr:ABC transporter ATP-binding protein [Acidimicrobiia bacterium]